MHIIQIWTKYRAAKKYQPECDLYESTLKISETPDWLISGHSSLYKTATLVLINQQQQTTH